MPAGAHRREREIGEQLKCSVRSVTQGVMLFDACMEGEKDISAWPKCANVLSATTLSHRRWEPVLRPPLHTVTKLGTYFPESLCPQLCLFDSFLVPSSCVLKEVERKGAFKANLSQVCLLTATQCVPFHSKQTASNTAAENNCILKTFTPVSYMVDVRL